MTGIVEFFDQGSVNESGNPLKITVNGRRSSRFTYTIRPRAAVQLGTSGETRETSVGSVWITPSGGSSSASAAILSFTNDSGITIAEATVPGLPAATGFEMYSEVSGSKGRTDSIDTAVAIANPWPSKVTVNVQVTRPDGSFVGQPVVVTVPGSGQIARFLTQLVPALPTPFEGFLR
jgi:hypothetical protein